MNDDRVLASKLLKEWKKECYHFGSDALNALAQTVYSYGKRVLVVASLQHDAKQIEEQVRAMQALGITVVGGKIIPGAKPNSPREDVFRIETYILHLKPDCVLAFGGGSTIDACKTAIILAAFGAEYSATPDDYFGAGQVTKAMAATGKRMLPLIAVETAASSGAHLTKYANVTDVVTSQKNVIVDPAIIPTCAFFDYRMSCSMSRKSTLAGILDAIAHVFESFCSAKPEQYELLERITLTALSLIFDYAPRVLRDPNDIEAREAIGLATDLGGYAIMLGATSGAHLTSFSLVDLTEHGVACGLMNPYFTVFYSPAIQRQLKAILPLFCSHGYLDETAEQLEGRALAESLARGFLTFQHSINAPERLSDIHGFSEQYVERILKAAKDPALAVKLNSMPVPITADEVETYMRPVVRAAIDGDLTQILIKR